MALVLVLAVLFVLFLAFGSSRMPKNVPPGSLGLPLVGETLEFFSSLRISKSWIFFQDRVEKYGTVFKTSLLLSPTVMAATPAWNKFIFSNESKLVESSWPSSIVRLLGPHSLANKTGDEYKRSRDVLLLFLKPESLRKYVGRASKIALQHLASNWQDKDLVGSFWCMKKYTFTLVCNLFLSLENESDVEELMICFHVFEQGLVQLPLNFPGTRFYKAMQSRGKILGIFDKLISQRKKELEQGCIAKDHDMLSVLMSEDIDGRLVSEAEIKDNILLALSAGYNTSSSTLTMILKYLDVNPIWKDKLLREHLQVRDSSAGPVLDWQDLQKMKWTWRVVQETLRIQPPVAFVFRKAIKDFEYEGYKIPKGWKLCWSIDYTHHDERSFPQPHKFDPSRFKKSTLPYSYIPFGGGPRMCAGSDFAKMEMLVFLHYFILRYDWSLIDKDEGFKVDPTPVPKKGLFVKIQPR